MSNCSPYVDRFFASLEMYEDKERGHAYKAYLKETVQAFLRNETPETAFDVYRAFFDCYRITLPGKTDPFLDLVDMLRAYENTAATLIDKQRDHFVHAANAFITGLCVFAANAPYRAAFEKAVLQDPAYKNAYSTNNEEFFYRWGLAALFHDVGYPVEIVGQQINRFIRFVTDADGSEVKVKARIEYENFDELNSIAELTPKRAFTKAYYDAYESCSYIDLLKPLDLISHRIHVSLGTDLFATKRAMDGFVADMARSGFIDHGYYSAVIVLKWYGHLIQKCGYNPAYLYWPVLDSATAIMLHNAWRNLFLKEPFSRPPMGAEENPIAFLLILCDELQEWNREARGIVTRTFTLADTVNLSVTDARLEATFVTKKGSLPQGFCQEKEALLRSMLNITGLFPGGLDVDCASLDALTPLSRRVDQAAPRPLLENVELLAIAIHALYNQNELKRHPDTPLRYPKFSDLPEDLLFSNMRQARSICDRLGSAGYRLAEKGLPGAISSFPADVIELFAAEEHADWVNERAGNGWTCAPERNVEKKTSPYLVPYGELPEEIKEYDRDAARNIPLLADLVGMAVYGD